MSENTRVLVTGGAGFIGSHLCDALLTRADEVWCADNLHLGRLENIAHLQRHPRFHFRRIDLLDRPATDAVFAEGRFAMVYHLAANSDIRQSIDDHQVDLRLTFSTTLQTLQAMLRHGVRRIFFASTSAIFGETAAALDERFGPQRPVSFYGAAKAAAEAFLSVMVHRFGMQAWVLRFPNVVGERCTHGAVHDFIERLRCDPSGLDVLGNGRQTKPYIYVGDLVDAIRLVCRQTDEALAVYHVAGEGLTSVREIARIVVEEMGLGGIPIRYTDESVGWVGDVSTYNYDTGKIAAIGFSPRYDSTQAVRVAVRGILDTQQPGRHWEPLGNNFGIPKVVGTLRVP